MIFGPGHFGSGGTEWSSEMRFRRRVAFIAGPLVALVGAIGVAAGPLTADTASAAPFSDVVYAYAPGSPACGPNAYATISAAVAAAQPGGTVIACPGTYSEDVVVTEPVTIIGRHAVVDPGGATNSPFYPEIGNNAFTILSEHVTISGFTVEDATGDGIVTADNNTTLVDDVALNNGGTGFDLNGSSWSTVSFSRADGNTGGGIYLTDDLDTPASHDLVVGNVFDGNLGGCGIILADHTGAGIFDNRIVGNQADDNGNTPAGTGAGVVLASPVPGGAVYDNVISGNSISGNGLAGVTLHSHLSGQNFSGNVVTGNDIGTNNVGLAASAAVGADDSDPYTTAVYVGSANPLTITVSGNIIHDDTVGIYADGAGVTVNGANFNWFFGVDHRFVTNMTYEG